MSLHIYVAHTGEHLLADPVSFSSPEALRTWIAQNISIATQRQILMTGRGKNVKIQTLLTENEIFVYDKQYIAPPSASSQLQLPQDEPLPPTYTPSEPPSSLSSPDSLQAWQDLFRSRRTWALDVAERLAPCQGVLQDQTARISVINRAVTVAIDNLRSHVASMQSRFGETRLWAQDTIKDQRAAVNDWQGALEVLSDIPAKDEFAFLLRRPTTPIKRDTQRVGTLHSFVSIPDLQDAAVQAMKSSELFEEKVAEVERALRGVISETEAATEDVRNSPVEPLTDEDIGNLFEESETFAKKINSDYEHILRLPDNSKSIASTSRMALGHTRDFLPSLQAVAQEIDQAVKACIQAKNVAIRSALRNMQNISVIESGLASIQSQIQTLDIDSDGIDAFDTLDLVFRLPTAYGSALIESLRRGRWDEKVRTDSASLAEEMAVYKDEEQRRRRKWLKTMAPFVDETQETSTMEMEVNVRGSGNTWPSVSREEINAYVVELQKHGIEDAHAAVTKMIQEFESPSKQQRKRAKAFKNGSLYEAGFGIGRSSLLLRGEDESLRSVKDENFKLSDRLKASESRVRRLEAILHSSGPLSRPVSGTFGINPSDFERNVLSPLGPSSPRPNDGPSRRSSVSSRRMSTNQTGEERSLASRIVSLEADLMQERDLVSKLRQEAHSERRSSTEHRDRMNEAESTKKDLMANFDARRQEFEDERQLLEDEIHKLKLRLEEVEDELDRVIGSRDQEKLIMNSQVTKDRERLNFLEKQLQDNAREKSSLQARNIDLANQLRDAVAAREDYIASLQAAHVQLSPEGAVPDDLGHLVHAVEVLSEGLAIHARSSDGLAQLVSAENKQLESRIAQSEQEITALREEITSKETEATRAHEAVLEEQSKLDSVRAKLANKQDELKTLRDKLADGETGSSELRVQLVVEQQRVAQLTEQLAGTEANAKNSEREVQTWKEKIQKLADNERQLKQHLDGRGRRGNELSRRLYAQNDRMIRVMEQMGYLITRQDDQLAIQRASKASSNSTTLSSQTAPSAPEPLGSMNRSLSGAYPVPHYSDAADIDLLYWSDNDAASEDRKFQDFIGSLTRLDLDAASDLIAKRYKDVETLARKWQRDSRSYREKYHRAQSEAHEKIAYRNFREGDLALFLPTRNQATRPWAAFNVGAPHYFLREQDSHKLQARDWLLARISRIEERVVDLSRSMQDRRSLQAETSDAGSMRSVDDENPFELSDGLRWYMLDAYEEKPGAPTTPGLGKSTVAATNVDARGSIPLMKEKKKARDSIGAGNAAVATKTLSKSLDSRRSSSASKKGHSTGQIGSSMGGVPPLAATEGTGDERAGDMTSAQQAVAGENESRPSATAREDAAIFEEDETQPPKPSRSLSPKRGGASAGIQLSSSPSRSSQVSPQKQKLRPWDRLWSLEYRSEHSRG